MFSKSRLCVERLIRIFTFVGVFARSKLFCLISRTLLILLLKQNKQKNSTGWKYRIVTIGNSMLMLSFCLHPNCTWKKDSLLLNLKDLPFSAFFSWYLWGNNVLLIQWKPCNMYMFCVGEVLPGCHMWPKTKQLWQPLLSLYVKHQFSMQERLGIAFFLRHKLQSRF